MKAFTLLLVIGLFTIPGSSRVINKNKEGAAGSGLKSKCFILLTTAAPATTQRQQYQLVVTGGGNTGTGGTGGAVDYYYYYTGGSGNRRRLGRLRRRRNRGRKLILRKAGSRSARKNGKRGRRVRLRAGK